MQTVRLIYTFLLMLAAPFLLFSLYKPKPGTPPIGRRWVEHFGFSKPITSRPLWVHAVSVGEVLAAKPFIQALKTQHPELPILVTTTTTTGAEQASKLGMGIEHRYMPIDFCWTTANFIRRIQPRGLLIMETELWPNTLATAKKMGISVNVINARLSEKSKLRYQQFHSVFKMLSRNLDLVICQFPTDAHRFVQLGLTQNKVKSVGSMKFDICISPAIEQAAALLKEQWKDRPVWIAASTHKGEDEQIIKAHKQVLEHHPNALLLLVPRHPERFDQVAELLESNQLQITRRSQGKQIGSETQVYLGDTMGEMMVLFASANIAFMGGSLLGDKVGGHNMLEPAALAKPILTGPSYFNFQIITEQLLEAHACQICHDTAEISNAVIELFDQPEKQHQQGKAALEVVNNNKGAVVKTIDLIHPLITS